ncbi:hypothetical protein GCM10023063_11770 [Arthrobacter methylotrophus]
MESSVVAAHQFRQRHGHSCGSPWDGRTQESGKPTHQPGWQSPGELEQEMKRVIRNVLRRDANNQSKVANKTHQARLIDPATTPKIKSM